jgi:hypothetical protein
LYAGYLENHSSYLDEIFTVKSAYLALGGEPKKLLYDQQLPSCGLVDSFVRVDFWYFHLKMCIMQSLSINLVHLLANLDSKQIKVIPSLYHQNFSSNHAYKITRISP